MKNFAVITNSQLYFNVFKLENLNKLKNAKSESEKIINSKKE